MLHIDSDFDGGNIEVLRIAGDRADLAIRPDSNGPWFQWFYFRVRGAAGRALRLRIVNAGHSAYPQGWAGYRACVSGDNENWRRTETNYEGGILEIRGHAEEDETWFAYFAPYDLARLDRFCARAASNPIVTARHIGDSVDGRPISRLSLGQGPRQIWLLGRQHSGETMASWWMEGAVDRLLNADDPVAARLLTIARIHVVPLINIDGAARGNLRGNAAGVDLNRQWHAPDPVKAPEVAAVLAAMEQTGVDLSLDVHGDETLPHVFVDGCDHDPLPTEAQIAGVAAFKSALMAASPAFQTVVGYDATYGGEGAPGMSTRAIARRFGAVGLTLEMPFKDSAEAPDPALGWSPAASARLGHDCIDALCATLESFRK
jgi:murein tripeptide amidase MpaA